MALWAHQFHYIQEKIDFSKDDISKSDHFIQKHFEKLCQTQGREAGNALCFEFTKTFIILVITFIYYNSSPIFFTAVLFLLCKTADTYIWNCTSSLGIKHSYTSFKQQKGSFTGLDYLGSKWAASGPQFKMSFTSRSRKIKLYRRKISKSAFRLNCHFRLTCNFCLFVLFFCTIKFPFAFFATF